MRVLVCGGREFGKGNLIETLDFVDEVLRSIPRTAILVHGDARGADRIASRLWRNRGLQDEPHPADWAKNGRSAGPIRNQEMLDTGIDLVIAFPGGAGTADCVRRARRAGIKVHEPGYPVPQSGSRA